MPAGTTGSESSQLYTLGKDGLPAFQSSPVSRYLS